ncbi:tetratricopeptide repeat protein [uncultured Marixanthomonas sp.]|uniref:transcriptional regulator n=1 Tax=uncultured Marixanthomonas sp. TaxID=757245 RepID=UPI0030DCE3E8
MRAYYSLLFLLLLLMLPLGLIAQSETKSEVIERIDLGVEYMSKKKHLLSIEELFSAKERSLQEGWYLQAFTATLNIGTNYYMMLDYGEALQYYLQAYEIAINHLEARQKKTVYNNIGVLYIEEKDPIKAEEYFLKAYAIAKELGDKEQIGACAVNLALLANEMGKVDVASAYIEEAEPLLDKKKNVILLAKIARVENLLLRDQLVQAERLALRTLPQLDNLSIVAEGATVNSKITLLLIISNIYKQQNKYQKAREYALIARGEQQNIEGRIEIYERISTLYPTKDVLPIAMAYKDSVQIASDSLDAKKNGALFKSEKVKLQIQNYKYELLESKKIREQEKQFFYKLIIGVVIVMGFLIWLYKNNALKHKQRKKIVELELAKEKSDHLLQERQRQQKEAMVLLEKERLKNELERKNRELTAKAMSLASKNELIEEVVQSLSSNVKIANDARLKTQINDLKAHLKNDTQWDSFFTHFEELNRGFLTRLMAKHKKLTSNDIRFLTFIYMNLSYKEIASLLNITSQSCRKRKERISKKMDVPEHISLQAYLSAI